TRLAEEGKATSAQVLDRAVRSGRKSMKRYYLTVQFQTDAGQSVHGRVQVNKMDYRASETTPVVMLRYLPSDPTICAVGEPFPAWKGQLISSTLLLLSGGIL